MYPCIFVSMYLLILVSIYAPVYLCVYICMYVSAWMYCWYPTTPSLAEQRPMLMNQRLKACLGGPAISVCCLSQHVPVTSVPCLQKIAPHGPTNCVPTINPNVSICWDSLQEAS